VRAMKYYTISQFAKLIGKTTQTLRNWDEEGYVYKKNFIIQYSRWKKIIIYNQV